MMAEDRGESAPRRSCRSEPTVDDYFAGVRAGERVMLARALTLVESTHPQRQEQAEQLLTRLMPLTGNSIRVGITGPPGAGKSTLIEALGAMLVEQGHRVAVLAIDPSSELTGGSILGDKTRMTRLAASPRAFIRPTPSSGTLGGAAMRTRESMLLFEAAGYDIVLVETVGVGQSESFVAQMTDCLVAVMLPLGGDELQAIKKGLLEFTDLVVVNKADGDMKHACQVAARQYRNALSTAGHDRSGRQREVLTCSALHDDQIEAVWQAIAALHASMRADGALAARRQRQNLHWLWAIVEGRAMKLIKNHAEVRVAREQLERDVTAGAISAEAAARKILQMCGLI